MTFRPNWRKSSYSANQTVCVEVAGWGIDGRVWVRDTKNRDGATLSFAPTEWSAFVHGVRAGASGR